MKKLNNGFILSELLIIVLGIFPIFASYFTVNNVAEQASEETNLRSIEAYAKSLETAYYVEMLNGSSNIDINNLKPDYSGLIINCSEKKIVDGNFVLKGCKIENQSTIYEYTNNQAKVQE